MKLIFTNGVEVLVNSPTMERLIKNMILNGDGENIEAVSAAEAEISPRTGLPKRNYNSRIRHKRFTPIEVEQLKQWYDERRSYPFMARQLHRTEKAVTAMVWRLKTKGLITSGRVDGRKHKNKEEEQEILNEYKQ